MNETAQRDEHQQAAEQLRKLVSQFWQWQAGDYFAVDSWSPAINLYRVGERIELCVDLSGLDPGTVDVQVSADKIVVRGNRVAPEPRQSGEMMKILAMEIDHGLFCRAVAMPQELDLGRVQTEYVNGLLWVRVYVLSEG